MNTYHFVRRSTWDIMKVLAFVVVFGYSVSVTVVSCAPADPVMIQNVKVVHPVSKVAVSYLSPRTEVKLENRKYHG